MPCLGLLVLFALQDPPVRDWMEGLRADRAEERTRAFNQLRTLGRGAEPWLKKGARDPDPELAERSRLLLRTVGIRESLPPALLCEFPGIENRMALEPGQWTAALIEAARQTGDGPAHPSLGWTELNALALRALQGVGDPLEMQVVCDIIGNNQLRVALPGLHELLRIGDAAARRRVLGTLGQLRSPSSVGPVAELLEDPELRGEAAWALARFMRQSSSAVLAREAVRPEASVRSACLQTIENHPTADAIPLLRLLAGDPEYRVRIQAGGQLANLGQDVGDIFIPLLQHPLPYVRSQAQYFLSSRRPPALLPRIRTLLQSPDPELRTCAVWLLSSYQDIDSAADIAELLDDPQVPVRRAAMSSLRQLRGAQAIPRIARMLTDPSEEIRSAALVGLALLEWREILPDVAARIEDPDESLRLQAIDLLGRSDLQAFSPELGRRLLDPSVAVRARAIRCIGWKGMQEHAPAIVSCLASPDDAEARQAESTLIALGSKQALPFLVRGLSHPDAMLRQHCFSVLLHTHPLEAAAALPRLLDDPDSGLRKSAVSAVADLGALAAIPRLRGMLKDPDVELRTGAARVLCQLQATDTTADILPLLSEPALADQIWRSLCHMGGREAIPALTKILGTPDHPARGAALKAIVELQGDAAIPLLRGIARNPEHPHRLDALTRMAALESWDTVPDLLDGLKARSQTVQEIAAQGLASIGAREAIPLLMEKLQEDVPGERAALIDALGRLGAVDAGPLILPLLRAEDCQTARTAIRAVELLDLCDAIPGLRALSRGDDLSLWNAASIALVHLGDRDEVPRLLTDYPRDLVVLNRIRRPELWARLRATPLARDCSGPLVDLWRELACDAGLELRIETGLSDRDRTVRSRGGATSLLDMMEDLDTDSSYVPIFEDRWIRLVDQKTAAAFWKEWWRREQAR